jgi:hypothetical protein
MLQIALGFVAPTLLLASMECRELQRHVQEQELQRGPARRSREQRSAGRPGPTPASGPGTVRSSGGRSAGSACDSGPCCAARWHSVLSMLTSWPEAVEEPLVRAFQPLVEWVLGGRSVKDLLLTTLLEMGAVWLAICAAVG